MSASFTARQGQFLAFIHGFTARHGYAPSFDEIAAHFGIAAPSVNSMIKLLDRRGALSRLPGVARSLRVLVPASALPASDFGGRAGSARARSAAKSSTSPAGADVAATVAIAALEGAMPFVVGEASAAGPAAVHAAAKAVHAALVALGFDKNEAADVASRIASEAARWEATGRGTVIPGRRWVRRRTVTD